MTYYTLTLTPEDRITPPTTRRWRSVYSEDVADLLVELREAILQERPYNLPDLMTDIARRTHFRWHQSLPLGGQVLTDFQEAVLAHAEHRFEPYLDRLAACAVRPGEEELVISMQQYRLLTPHTVESLLDVADLRVVA